MNTKYQFPAVHDEPFIIAGHAENLHSLLLCEPMSINALHVFGEEKRVDSLNTLIERWDGEYGSIRFLFREHVIIQGAIQFIKIDRRFLNSNIYVLIDRRRKGVASSLLREALSAFKLKLRLSQFLTLDGAALFGIQEHTVEK